MIKGQRSWTREELLLVINMYCKLPFGRLHSKNPELIHLSELIDRTPGAVAYKLVNFASLDPAQRARGIKGASNGSKMDKAVWHEFSDNWDELPFESETLRASFNRTTVEKINMIDESDLPKEGRERERIVKARVNHAFFRSMILATYDNTCCITGLQMSSLLVAGHIKPWSQDEKNRMNPRNGIALNSLHDKAFEEGLLTITPDYTVRISSSLKREKKNPAIQEYFLKYDSQKIKLPQRFLPEEEFFVYHNRERFVA